MGSEPNCCQESLSLSFSVQPFSINSAQTSLLKRVKLKPQFWKLQNSFINAQPSPLLREVQAWGGTAVLRQIHTMASTHKHTCTHTCCMYTCFTDQRHYVHGHALYTTTYTAFKPIHWFTLWGTRSHNRWIYTCLIHMCTVIALWPSASFLPFFQTLTKAISYNSWGCCIATGQTALATTTLSFSFDLNRVKLSFLILSVSFVLTVFNWMFQSHSAKNSKRCCYQ